jgi:hypothetical protein
VDYVMAEINMDKNKKDSTQAHVPIYLPVYLSDNIVGELVVDDEVYAMLKNDPEKKVLELSYWTHSETKVKRLDSVHILNKSIQLPNPRTKKSHRCRWWKFWCNEIYFDEDYRHNTGGTRFWY